MSCLNNRRMKDLDHVSSLAKKYANEINKDVAVIQVNKSGIGAVYDFIESDKIDISRAKKIINPQETNKKVRKLSDDKSENILQNTRNEQVRTSNKKRESKEKRVRKPLVHNTGVILSKNKSNESSEVYEADGSTDDKG